MADVSRVCGEVLSELGFCRCKVTMTMAILINKALIEMASFQLQKFSPLSFYGKEHGNMQADKVVKE